MTELSTRRNGERIRLILVPVADSETPDRKEWVLNVADHPAGRLTGERTGNEVSLSVCVVEPQRRRGIAKGAIGRVLGSAPWGRDVEYVMAVESTDAAAAAVARSTAFVEDTTGQPGGSIWRRRSPMPRGGAADITRFLTRSGRIDRYPSSADQRRLLLEWVLDRAMTDEGGRSEAEINQALEPYAPGSDTAVLRRYLVDHELLERTASGSEYRRVVR